MKLFVVFVVSFTVALALPHPRQGCTIPSELESSLESKKYSSVTACKNEPKVNLPFDFHTGFFARGKLAHDAREERIRFDEEVEENSTRSFHSDLYLYKQHVHYRLDLKTRHCSKMMLNGTFPHIEIHPNASYLGDVVIGSLNAPGSGVIVQNWRYRTTNGEGLQIITLECIPVQFEYLGMHGGERIHYHRVYFDVTRGIRDPSIFEVPKECL